MLRVAGNQLKTPDGRVIILQGVNIPSLEWSTGGDRVLESTREAIDNWKAKAIRLPLSQDRWFGKEPGQSDAGGSYRELVTQVVSLASRKGAYVILDLHWSNAGVWGRNLSQHEMPDENSIEFWKDAAARWANHPAVLFDLYNEPHDVTWEVWRNGGVVEETDRKERKTTYRTPGMQALLNAVRATGARNIVIAGGLDWAYDLTGVLNGFALDDKSGNGVMYASHIYPHKRDWELKVGAIADRHPVLIGEVGCESDDEQGSPYVWGPDVIGYIQKRKLSWTAWCFHTESSPRMLQDWNYTPSPYWGAFVKAALLGTRYQADRMR
jgi:aryl-phospho-beta-D-glucosidase BglC (GH1 family)